MKVKDCIEQLTKLDPERNIWVIYDSFCAFAPEFEVLNEDTCSFDIDYIDGVQPGDYVFVVW